MWGRNYDSIAQGTKVQTSQVNAYTMCEGEGILTRSPNLQFKEFFLYRQSKDVARWNDKERSERIRAEQTAISPSSASQILPG